MNDESLKKLLHSIQGVSTTGQVNRLTNLMRMTSMKAEGKDPLSLKDLTDQLKDEVNHALLYKTINEDGFDDPELNPDRMDLIVEEGFNLMTARKLDKHVFEKSIYDVDMKDPIMTMQELEEKLVLKLSLQSNKTRMRKALAKVAVKFHKEKALPSSSVFIKLRGFRASSRGNEFPSAENLTRDEICILFSLWCLTER